LAGAAKLVPLAGVVRLTDWPCAEGIPNEPAHNAASRGIFFKWNGFMNDLGMGLDE
jgi:hypothetical protein